MSSSFSQSRQATSSRGNNQQTSNSNVPRDSKEDFDAPQTIFSPENAQSIEEEALAELIVDALDQGDGDESGESSSRNLTFDEMLRSTERADREGGDVLDILNAFEQEENKEEQDQDDESFLEQRRSSFWSHFVGLVRKSAINLVLPFINGMMLGFGEILAHEIGFHYHWHGAKVEPPRRLAQRKLQDAAGSRYL
ncbi:hypothetical protein I9W82_002220 [Candida metapsilosis]|uniref:Mim1p n=1 Tax=Candida metapsilosis TaxID=273372 RepID=A0A8H7ZGW8_9ASCO|nr:hypothetical protein I9W82_002220 [Candida metapsilosis]